MKATTRTFKYVQQCKTSLSGEYCLCWMWTYQSSIPLFKHNADRNDPNTHTYMNHIVNVI